MAPYEDLPPVSPEELETMHHDETNNCYFRIDPDTYGELWITEEFLDKYRDQMQEWELCYWLEEAGDMENETWEESFRSPQGFEGDEDIEEDVKDVIGFCQFMKFSSVVFDSNGKFLRETTPEDNLLNNHVTQEMLDHPGCKKIAWNFD